MKKIIFTVLLLCGISISSFGQTIVHDKQKEKQWRSMENGPWDFAPDWYYWNRRKSNGVPWRTALGTLHLTGITG